MTEVAVREYFDGVAMGYAERSKRYPWRWLRRREREMVARFVEEGLPLGASALDLGCGSGFYAEVVRAAGVKHLAVMDQSPRMLAELSVPVEEKICADAARTFASEKYDLITCCGMLEFCENPALVLANVTQALAPGGRAILLVPKRNWAGLLYRSFHRGHGIRARLFRTHEITSALENCGLVLVRAVTVLPMTLVLEAKKPVKP